MRGMIWFTCLLFAVASPFGADGVRLSGKLSTAKGDPVFGVAVQSRAFGLRNLTNPSGEWTLACDSCPGVRSNSSILDTVQFIAHDSMLGTIPVYSPIQTGVNLVLNTERPGWDVAYDYHSCANRIATEDSLALVNTQIGVISTRGRSARRALVIAGLFSMVAGVAEMAIWGDEVNKDGTSWIGEVATMSGWTGIGFGGFLALKGLTMGPDSSLVARSDLLKIRQRELRARQSKFRIAPAIHCDF